MKNILLINGPNLNLLGIRQPEIYGAKSLSEIILNLKNKLPNSENLNTFQSNIEGEIVNFLNAQYLELKKGSIKILGIIINPGAYGHTSIAIRDALEMFYTDKISIYEVHLTHVMQRENFRHSLILSGVVHGLISGLGAYGYEAALEKIKQEHNLC